jgi:outer membrane protein insertion porin family
MILSTFPLFAQEELEGLVIDDLVFTGADHTESAVLENLAAEFEGKSFSTELFSQIQNQLDSLPSVSYYYASASRLPEDPQGAVILEFTITERPLVNEVIFTGNSVFDDNELLDEITTSEGSFFQNAAVTSDRQALAAFYLDKGYTSSQVESSVERDRDNNTATVTFTIFEGKQSKIDSIEFIGNESYSTNSLKRVLTSKEQSLFNKGDFSEANIQQDMQAIREYYGDRGYVDAQVSYQSEVSSESDASKELVVLTFTIDEGTQWRFGGLEVSGNTIFTEQQIMSRFNMKQGDPLNISQLQENVGRIADLYWNEGYIYNDIEPKENRNEQDQSISYELLITEKSQAYIEDIVIKGNERTLDHVLYRELTVEIGDVFSKEAFIESVQNLYNTGIIASVDYNVLFGSEDGQIVLEFIVEESNRIDLQFGATFGGSDEFPVSGFLSWNDKNFTGRGQDLSVSLNVASSSQTLDFSFDESWLAGRRWNGGFNFSVGHNRYNSILTDEMPTLFSDEDYFEGDAVPDPFDTKEQYAQALNELGSRAVGEEYLMEYEQWELSLGFNTGYTFHTDVGRLGVNGGLQVGLTNVDWDTNLYSRPFNPIVRNNYDTWNFSNKLNLTLSWDGRDLIENTTTGFLFQNSTIYAGGVLGGTRSYIRNNFGASGFLTLFELSDDELKPRNIVFAARSTLSFVFPQFFTYDHGFGVRPQPIATQAEKLYIDGMTVARGYQDPTYNLEFLFDTIFDVSVPIAPNILSGEVFFSATGYKANYEEAISLGLTDFIFSSGAGIKLTIPGFPIGLYLTKVFEFDENNQIKWQPGDIFRGDDPTSGLNLVFAITYSLY